MGNERDQVIKMLDAAQATLLKQDRKLARAIGQSFDVARRELLESILARFTALGDDPTPGQLRTLANDVALHSAIRNRILALGGEFEGLLREVLEDVAMAAGDDVLAQISLMASGLNIPFYTFVIDELVELVIAPAIEQIPGLVASMQTTLITELRIGLAQGEKFSSLASRLLGKDGSIFSRGETSAKLMARRAVVQANNNSRLIFMQRGEAQVPGLKKQVIAHFDSKTTRLSMQMHGEIQDVDKPFDMPSGPPTPFARRMMAPPFCWNDRDSMVPYHKRFEERSTLTTEMMKQQAREALQALDNK